MEVIELREQSWHYLLIYRVIRQ